MFAASLKILTTKLKTEQQDEIENKGGIVHLGASRERKQQKYNMIGKDDSL